MFEWLTTLTQPQATLGASFVTFVGAIAAVLLGWLLFSAKVRDLRSALTATDTLVQEHGRSVEKTLGNIEQKIAGLAVSTGQLRGEASDREAVEEAALQPEANNDQQPTQITPFQRMSEAWFKVRDRLEEIAADPKIDGRTSAKYARIDRRRYGELVVSLAKDNRLSTNGSTFLEAVQLWASFRTRRKEPSPAEASRMEDLASLLMK